ncbi:MAG: hypothetical protein HW399_986 [Dehalococcoidia bacterium]|nr:hypothetical protein [Dehalococcoidia bacterium]
MDYCWPSWDGSYYLRQHKAVVGQNCMKRFIIPGHGIS